MCLLEGAGLGHPLAGCWAPRMLSYLRWEGQALADWRQQSGAGPTVLVYAEYIPQYQSQLRALPMAHSPSVGWFLQLTSGDDRRWYSPDTGFSKYNDDLPRKASRGA